MTITQVLHDASEQEALTHAKVLRDRRIQYATDVYGVTNAYDNAVTLAGYAAFFALWAGTANDIVAFARLVTVFLMSISLMLYIGFVIWQMLVRQKFEHEMADCFDLAGNPKDFNQTWEDIEARRNKAMMATLKFWPYVFLPSIVFGFAAAFVLSINALSAAFGWPQLTGHF